MGVAEADSQRGTPMAGIGTHRFIVALFRVIPYRMAQKLRGLGLGKFGWKSRSISATIKPGDLIEAIENTKTIVRRPEISMKELRKTVPIEVPRSREKHNLREK